MDEAGFWNGNASLCGDAPDMECSPMERPGDNPLHGLYVYRSGSRWLMTSHASHTPSEVIVRQIPANQNARV